MPPNTPSQPQPVQPQSVPVTNQAPQPAFPISNQTAVTPKTKRIPTWLKIASVVVVIIILFFVGIFVFVNEATKAPEKVSNEWVADIQTDNSSAAYSLTTSAFRNSTSQEELAEIIGSVSPALQGKTNVIGKAVNSASGQPEEAIIVYTVSTSNGTKYIRVVLYKNNNVWQVQNFRSSNTALNISSDN